MPKGISSARVQELTMNSDLRLSDEEHGASAGLLHFCDDWDFLLIDKSDPEFDACCCAFAPGYPDKP